MSEPITIKDLHKSFGEQKVLDGITLNVPAEKTLTVLGRSGIGKSVLLKLIIGLQHPDSGSIAIHGKETTGLDFQGLNEVRKKVGFLFQDAALYDSLTIEENVAFPLDPDRARDALSSEQKDRVHQLLESVGMQEHLDKLPSEISGGMQKRVGLARALALEPDIILFDRPTTAGLDPITAGEIDELIVKLQTERKITSVVVTHDVHGAKTISDRVVLIDQGKIVMEGTFDELTASDNSFAKQFLARGGA